MISWSLLGCVCFIPLFYPASPPPAKPEKAASDAAEMINAVD
jgi:hypothetical protein